MPESPNRHKTLQTENHLKPFSIPKLNFDDIGYPLAPADLAPHQSNKCNAIKTGIKAQVIFNFIPHI